MSRIILYIFSLLILSTACNQVSSPVEPIEPILSGKDILKNFSTYWAYYNKYVKLHEDFIALNDSSKQITKEEFFEKLIKQRFLPLRLYSNDKFQYYQLYKIPDTTNQEISKIISQMADYDYKDFIQEGKKIPEFNFTDLKGNVFNNVNTKGKTIVIKCWFIHCVKCVEEFPDLNNLVESYKGRKDIIFLSLAIDNEKDLEKFLIAKPLKYDIISNQGNFIKDSLQIFSFPTHLLVDKNGMIVKRVNTYEDIKSALSKEISKVP